MHRNSRCVDTQLMENQLPANVRVCPWLWAQWAPPSFIPLFLSEKQMGKTGSFHMSSRRQLCPHKWHQQSRPRRLLRPLGRLSPESSWRTGPDPSNGLRHSRFHHRKSDRNSPRKCRHRSTRQCWDSHRHSPEKNTNPPSRHSSGTPCRRDGHLESAPLQFAQQSRAAPHVMSRIQRELEPLAGQESGDCSLAKYAVVAAPQTPNLRVRRIGDAPAGVGAGRGLACLR